MSGKQHGESHEAPGENSPAEAATGKKERRKPTADVGRALRSVYDDTLRESVPDDFLDLLGKLS